MPTKKKVEAKQHAKITPEQSDSAAWDRAIEKAAQEIDRELRWRITEVDDSGRALASGFMRPLDELARIIRALRGKYDEFTDGRPSQRHPRRRVTEKGDKDA